MFNSRVIFDSLMTFGNEMPLKNNTYVRLLHVIHFGLQRKCVKYVPQYPEIMRCNRDFNITGASTNPSTVGESILAMEAHNKMKFNMQQLEQRCGSR